MEKEHFEIILERMDTKFDLLIECYNSLNRKIDENQKKNEALYVECVSLLSRSLMIKPMFNMKMTQNNQKGMLNCSQPIFRGSECTCPINVG